MAIDPRTNDIVDFQLVQNGILGDGRVDVAVTASGLTYETAKLIDPQLNVKHTALFQYFQSKVGGVDNPAAYQYFAVRDSNGSVEVIGIPWVNETTFKVVVGRIRNYSFNNWQEKFEAPFHKFLRDMGISYTYSDKVET